MVGYFSVQPRGHTLAPAAPRTRVAAWLPLDRA
jgi:hypothetical protein